MKLILALASTALIAGCASSSDSRSPEAYGSVFGGYGPYSDRDWDDRRVSSDREDKPKIGGASVWEKGNSPRSKPGMD